MREVRSRDLVNALLESNEIKVDVEKKIPTSECVVLSHEIIKCGGRHVKKNLDLITGSFCINAIIVLSGFILEGVGMEICRYVNWWDVMMLHVEHLILLVHATRIKK